MVPALITPDILKSLSDTYVRVQSIDERTACSSGSSEVQTIVAESKTSLDGYFYVHLGGQKSAAIAVTASSSDVEAVLNDLTSVVGDVSVSHYVHTDYPSLVMLGLLPSLLLWAMWRIL